MATCRHPAVDPDRGLVLDLAEATLRVAARGRVAVRVQAPECDLVAVRDLAEATWPVAADDPAAGHRSATCKTFSICQALAAVADMPGRLLELEQEWQRAPQRQTSCTVKHRHDPALGPARATLLRRSPLDRAPAAGLAPAAALRALAVVDNKFDQAAVLAQVPAVVDSN
jgi:hypothetical protein